MQTEMTKRKATQKKKPDTNKALRAKALEIRRGLKRQHPDVKCGLTFQDPFQLLIATILSAQCTDERVNMVTPALFKKFPDAKAFARARIESIEELIRSTGFFRNKAKNIREASKAISREHDGVVPDNLEELVKLPGVGRKTANVVLSEAFGVPGLTVDTHMKRINHRFGLTENSDPVKVERDLMEILPKKHWNEWNMLVIWHGRRICKARNPDCASCAVTKDCDYFQTIARSR